jgi:hypothetical protein
LLVYSGKDPVAIPFQLEIIRDRGIPLSVTSFNISQIVKQDSDFGGLSSEFLAKAPLSHRDGAGHVFGLGERLLNSGQEGKTMENHLCSGCPNDAPPLQCASHLIEDPPLRSRIDLEEKEVLTQDLRE